MENIISVKHEVIKVKSSFEDFTRNLEAAAGRFDSTVLDEPNQDLAALLANVREQVDEDELAIFKIQDHGLLLSLFGFNQKAKQYNIGNPLIAATMTQHDLRAALYAPLKVLVYEAADHATYVEYDLPSTQFGMFGNADVTKVGLSLDEKLKSIISESDNG